MDQDHSDASGENPSWRDRLGIDENKPEGEGLAPAQPRPAAPGVSPAAPRVAPRAPARPPVMPGQYGAKSVPAAPLPPSQRPQTDAATPRAPRMPPMAPRPGSGAPMEPPPAGSTLAERLRVQRENAERLAEQRLALARQRAAARQAEQDSERTKREAAEVLSRPSTMPTEEPTMVEPARIAPRPSGISPDRLSMAARRPEMAPPAPRPAASAARPAPTAPNTPRPQADALAMPPLRSAARSEPTADRAVPKPAPASSPALTRPVAGEPRLAPRAPIAPARPAPAQAAPRPQASDDDFFEPNASTYAPPRQALGSARATQDSLYSEPRMQEPSRRLPILAIILALLAIIVLGGAWYVFKSVTDTGATQPQAPAEVPVVPAPVEPAKVDGGEPVIDTEGTATGKKLIYDRILGEDQETTGGEVIEPTEELPVPQAPDVEPLAPPPAEPQDQTGAAEPIPAPAEPPAPPAAEATTASDAEQLAALVAQQTAPAPEVPAPAPELAAPQTEASTSPELLPVPRPPVPGETPAAEAGQATQTTISVLPRARPQVPESFLARQQQDAVIEVTPQQPQQQGTTNFGAAQQAPITTNTITPALPDNVSGPQTIAPALIGTGYVAQLASFTTREEANVEYRRVRDSHTGIIGSLSPIITQADLGINGTFFRLGLGPLGSKDAASQLCQQLIAAGEKDCIVRRQ